MGVGPVPLQLFFATVVTEKIGWTGVNFLAQPGFTPVQPILARRPSPKKKSHQNGTKTYKIAKINEKYSDTVAVAKKKKLSLRMASTRRKFSRGHRQF